MIPRLKWKAVQVLPVLSPPGCSLGRFPQWTCTTLLVQGLGRIFFCLIDHFERLHSFWWALLGFKAKVFVRVAGYFLFPQLRRTPGRRGQGHCENTIPKVHIHSSDCCHHLNAGAAMKWCCRTTTAAAAAKSLQSCPTLCDPRDGSPPGSSVHGIFQARVLEWGAIAFSGGTTKLMTNKESLGCFISGLLTSHLGWGKKI